MANSRLFGLQLGVTFLELLVTVAVIGILAAIAVPYYGDYITRERWSGAAEAVFAEAQKARFAAVGNNKSIYLVYVASGAGWCFTLTESDPASVASGNCSGGYIGDASANLSTVVRSSNYPFVTVSPATSSIVEFQMPSMTTSGATTFSVVSDLGTIDVSVTSGMRVDICSTDTGRYGC